MTFSIVIDLIALALFLVALCGVAVALAVFIAVMGAFIKFIYELIKDAISKRRGK